MECAGGGKYSVGEGIHAQVNPFRLTKELHGKE
jgi:hypothetical protein